MREFGTLGSFFEEVGGRRLPRTLLGAIDMEQIRRDNEEFDRERMRYGRVALVSESGAAVSDAVTPERATQYEEAAVGIDGLKVIIDREGVFSDRGIPPEGYVYAIVDPKDPSVAEQYWQALDALDPAPEPSGEGE